MMKILWLLVLLAFLAHPAGAEPMPFYIAGGQGIYRDTLESETGKLGVLTTVSAIKDANFLAYSAAHQVLYATVSGAGKSAVDGFPVQMDGTLGAPEEKPTGANGACHVSVDATGAAVLVANYDGGSISCFPVGVDGKLGDRSALMAFTGSGPNKGRQSKPYGHSVYAAPGNGFVYACDLGSDHVWIFKFDAAQGMLTPADPPNGSVPPGSGPRHLAFLPGRNLVYVANEMGHSVTTFTRDPVSGALTARGTVSTLPEGTPDKGVTTAEIFCDAAGKRVYVSNRGCDTLAVFSIGADGALTLEQSAPSVAAFPRGFAIDPTGRWLVVAGQKGNRIVVQKIDPATGNLEATGETAEMPGPVCVVFPKG